MQIKLEIAVPVQYFFNQIIESARYDIHAQTGKQIAPRNLKNFTYRKQMANGQAVRFTITDYIADAVYAYTLNSGRNDYTVRYEMMATGDQHMTLIYQEDVAGNTKTVDANNRASGLLMGWFRKRRFKKMAKQIEATYLGTGTQLT